MDQSKVEISQPILSPTRSLDEGFESDPDRVSTDSELTSTAQNSTFDLLHRTDRDGVQHTTITRHKVTESVICIDAGVGSSESDSNDVKNEPKPRRVKSRAPAPPTVIHPRSHSVDRVRSDFNNSQNILVGRFVRVTVDPKQQYLNYFKNYKSYQHYQTNSRLLLPSATGSTSNLYKHQSVNNSTHEQSQPIISGLLSLSNLSSSMQQSYTSGYSQSVKGVKNYHQSHFSSHHHHQQQTQSHFLASSWTQSMDPRKARK